MQRQWKLCLLTFSFAMFALMQNSPVKALFLRLMPTQRNEVL